MKIKLLLGSALLATVSAFPQNNLKRPQPAGIYNMAETIAQKFALEPSEKTVQPKLNIPPTLVSYDQPNSSEKLLSAPPSSINWSLLGGSMNVYGMIVSNSRPLQYNANVNAVSFIHRKSTTYNETPAVGATAKNGVIVAEISTNWGATWDSTCLWSNNTHWGRYPQGAIYSAPGNTNIANAYFVGSGPTVAGTAFSGVFYASKQLGVPGSTIYNTTADATPGAQQFLSVTNPTYAPNLAQHCWSRYGFSSTDDGLVRSAGLIQNDQQVLSDMRGVAVAKGTYNAGVFNWTTDSIIPTTLVTSGGKKILSSNVQMVWNKKGDVGYVVMMGALSTASLANRSFQPIIYKTSNFGNSWAPVQGIDFNANTPDVNMVTRSLSGVVSGTDTIVLPYFNDYDAVVDTNNFLHIAATINSGAIAHNDSLNFLATYTMSINGPTVRYFWPHRPGLRPYIYDFYGDGTAPWKTLLIDSLPTEDPGAGSTSSGYNDNPWDPTGTANAKISMGPRLQLGRTPGGSFLTFSWTESDTNFTANAKKWNLLPNIKTRCLRVNGICPYYLSPTEINVSKPAAGQGTTNPNVAFRSTLHYMSPTTGTATPLYSAQNLTVDINTPLTITNNNPYAQLNNSTTWYAGARLSYSFSYSNINCIINVEKNTLNGSNENLLFPNPAQDQTTLMIDLKNNSKINLGVYNMVGQMVKSVNTDGQQGTNNIGIDLTNLSSGMYLIKVNADNATITKKLIIQ